MLTLATTITIGVVALAGIAAAWNGCREWIAAWREKRPDAVRFEANEAEARRLDAECKRLEVETVRLERLRVELVAELETAKKTFEATTRQALSTAKREIDEMFTQQQRRSS